MRFISSTLAVLGLAASALAQTDGFDPISKPAENQVLHAGSTFTIQWGAAAQYAKDTVTISLIGGATQGTQIPIADLATGVPNAAQQFSWSIDESLGADAVYGLVIKSDSDPSTFQYSYPFHIKSSGSSSGGYGSSASSSDSVTYVTTMTTTYGTKTITISSCTSTTSTVATTPAYNSTTSASSTYSAPSSWALNSTSSSGAVYTTITSSAIYAPTTAAPSVVPTSTPGAAAKVGSSSLALIGALLVAAIAL